MVHLFDILFPPRADEVILRNISTDNFLVQVTPRIVPETRPETIILLPFNSESVRAAIHEAKYHGNEKAFKLLSLALADYLHDADESFRKSIIVPVPLGKERLKERGFNQIEEVAKLAVRGLKIKIENDLIIRTRETVSQVSLQRNKREENMRGAFKATRRANQAYTYIVMDDVVTTGATLQAAIDALKDAGAEHIIPLALAH